VCINAAPYAKVDARSRYRAAVPAALPDLSSDYAVPEDRIDEFAREGHTVLREVCTRDEVAAYSPVIEAATKKHTSETRPIEARDTYGRAFLQVTQAVVEEQGLELRTHGEAAAGDATFHAGWTMYRAAANPTGNLRSVMTVIYFADGLRAAEPDHGFRWHDLKTWLPGVEPGELAASPLNPRL
jgi:hypothetical protein